MSAHACRDCQYWDEQSVLQQTPKGPTRVGLCFRFPPSVVATQQGAVAVFPSTQALQWCGEFQLQSIIQT